MIENFSIIKQSSLRLVSNTKGVQANKLTAILLKVIRKSKVREKNLLKLSRY